MEQKELLICIPVLKDPENLLTRALKGIFSQKVDFDFDVLVIDNNWADDNIRRQYEDESHDFDVYVIQNPLNLGVASSWNQAIEYGIKYNYKYVCCMGFDTVFLDNLVLQDSFNDMKTQDLDFGYGAGHMFNFWFMKLERCPQVVGTFDENFYPGYYEDYDYLNRLNILQDLGAIKLGPIKDDDHINDISRIKHDASSTIKKNPEFEMAQRHCWDANEQYIKQKWGTNKNEHKECYRAPFNDVRLPIGWWILDGQRRAALMEIWHNVLPAAKPKQAN